jgi:hypothetical protein
MIFILATILDNLTYQYQDIHENRSKTLDNYAAKKFHLNSFMNIVSLYYVFTIENLVRH